MKLFTTILSLLALSFFISCSSDTDDENNRLLGGTIGGEEWTYKYAKALYDQVEDRYSVEMYGQQQSESDPCSIFVSGENHLRFAIPNQAGNYQIPSQVPLRFDLAGTGNTLDATSGFIEITAVSEFRVAGYLQANFDEDNSVEGNFVFERCIR